MSTTTNPPRQRRAFAPVRGTPAQDHNALPTLQGIVFDMDGTLCEPQNYMFQEMRAALDIPRTTDILDHVHGLAEPQQSAALAKIEAIERTAMAKQTAQPGLVALLEFLDRRAVPKAICTRNFDLPVRHLLDNLIPAHVVPFSPVVTRRFKPPKPSPAGIFHIARAWGIGGMDGVDPEGPCSDRPRPLPLIMVGDSEDDMAAGRDAGCVTVLLKSPGKEDLEVDERTDVVVSRLDELVGLLEQGLETR